MVAWWGTAVFLYICIWIYIYMVLNKSTKCCMCNVPEFLNYPLSPSVSQFRVQSCPLFFKYPFIFLVIVVSLVSGSTLNWVHFPLSYNLLYSSYSFILHIFKWGKGKCATFWAKPMNKTTWANLWQAMAGLLNNWRMAEWLRCSHQGGEEHGWMQKEKQIGQLAGPSSPL